MKIQARRNVFETNSSSTHSLTICEEKYYEGWLKGTYAFDEVKKNFLPVEIDFAPLENMSKEEEQEIIENYTYDSGYWLTWDERDDEDKFAWYKDYQIKKKYGEQYETYQIWQEKRDYINNKGEINTYYTSPSGDKLVAFGYYGYNG